MNFSDKIIEKFRTAIAEDRDLDRYRESLTNENPITLSVARWMKDSPVRVSS